MTKQLEYGSHEPLFRLTFVRPDERRALRGPQRAQISMELDRVKCGELVPLRQTLGEKVL